LTRDRKAKARRMKKLGMKAAEKKDVKVDGEHKKGREGGEKDERKDGRAKAKRHCHSNAWRKKTV
jgi:hypothetical protein